MTRLLIVESPNKVDKIAHYLGDGWQVAASAGHIRDLPPHEIGVAGPEYWPEYVATERGGKTIGRLRKLAQSASEVWLATDPDREGEAIAWHLAQVLGKEHVYKRVTFNEISKTAIHKAIAAPRQIDRRLFLAQQGRRVLDRLYGYKVSPALGNKLGQHGLSAGRVQSVALRLVLEREEAIRNFQKVKHFGVLLSFASNNGTPDNGQWSARWTPPLTVRPGKDAHLSTADNADETPLVTDRAIAEAVLAAARQGVVVTDFAEKTQARKPPPPFTTSTLQQAASVQLHLGVNATMQAAQALFEAGLITYHRTDNPNLSDDGIQAVWALLRQRGQNAYIPDKPNSWKAKDGAQEAHEAIRPTDFSLYKGADCAERGVNAVQIQLYQLIWRRAVASQMKAAQFKVRSASLASTQPVAALDAVAVPADGVLGQQQATFTARGQEMIFAGWMRLAQGGDETGEKKTEGEEDASGLLPLLRVGDHHTPQDGRVLELETKPPGRFSEAGLVKKLEAEGIGRPATYAAIIGTLTGKGYVETVNRFFVPSALGEAIVNGLRDRFDFMEVHYTRDMEDELDAIAAGKADYQQMVAHYDQALDGQLAQFAQVELPRFAGAGTEDSATYPCPDCGDGVLRRIKGKNGYFWGCSHYNRDGDPCKATFPDVRGKPGKAKAPITKSTDHPCPACGKGYLQRRAGKKPGAYWWGCNAYPACKHTAPDNDGKPGVWGDKPASGQTPVKPATGKPSGKTATDGKTAGKRSGSTITRGGYRCPQCGGELVQRTGSKGVFWGCKNYPKCKHTEPDAHGEPRFAATE